MRYAVLPFVLIGLLQTTAPAVQTRGQAGDRYQQARIELPSIEMFNNGSVSPDGNALAMILDDGLTIIDLRTKQTRVILPNENLAGSPFWSPDGRDVAFTTQISSPEVRTEFRIVSRNGGIPRVIHSHAHSGFLQGWSRDGRFLLANCVDYIADSSPEELIGIMVADSSAHVLASFPSDGIRRAAYSPDSEFVVFDSSSSHALSSLTVIRADGSGAHALLADARANDGLIDWSPDGNVVILRDGNALAVPTLNGRSRNAKRV